MGSHETKQVGKGQTDEVIRRGCSPRLTGCGKYRQRQQITRIAQYHQAEYCIEIDQLGYLAMTTIGIATGLIRVYVCIYIYIYIYYIYIYIYIVYNAAYIQCSIIPKPFDGL